MAGRRCEAGSRTVTTWSSSTAHTTQAAHPSGVLCQLTTNASTSAAPGHRRAHACRVRERTVGPAGSERAGGEDGKPEPRSVSGTPWAASPVHATRHENNLIELAYAWVPSTSQRRRSATRPDVTPADDARLLSAPVGADG